MSGVLGLAFDGLRRKPGRNVLTLVGVAVGVLALTLIVSLGHGLAGLIGNTISGEEDLRQIGLSPGFGFRPEKEEVEEIEGEIRESFEHAGGESFTYIPCLNERPDHVEALADAVKESLAGWL